MLRIAGCNQIYSPSQHKQILEMLPILLYNNMDGHSSGVNNVNNNVNSSGSSYSHSQLYDDNNVILNSVRTRRKVSELPNCPVCSCTVRAGELEAHLALELERLHKLSAGGGKRKLSASSAPASTAPSAPPAVAGSSSAASDAPDEHFDVTGSPGGAEFQRVRANRLRRLRARRRSPVSTPATGECPVCCRVLPTVRLQRHALRCLRRTGATVDDDVPDTSSDDESIDVENDSPCGEADTSAEGEDGVDDGSGGGGRFGAEYRWCGSWRVRASALQPAAERQHLTVRRASRDTQLVVDGDEDTELYGPPQYSPSRIAPDAEISEPSTREEASSRTEENGPTEAHAEKHIEDPIHKANGLVEASAETRIAALKARIRELEHKQNAHTQAKCLICLGAHQSPAVSIQCWHVYCEECWLESLRAKKICPQCNAITTAHHLRRIYM